jgi:L1 cell adhesion molecule like protein
MVQEAAGFEAADKAHMELVEAKNGLESYVYNVRNSLTDEATRAKLGAELCDEHLEKAKGYISWLDENQSAEKSEYEAQKTKAEEDFRPFFMKLYATDEKTQTPEVPTATAGPKIEEVD